MVYLSEMSLLLKNAPQRAILDLSILLLGSEKPFSTEKLTHYSYQKDESFLADATKL